MKVGIGTYSFGGIASYLGLGMTLLEKFQKIKALGFDTVELLPVDLDNDIEDIKKWLKETGLTVTSIHAEPSEEIVKKIAELGGQAVIWASSPSNSKEEAISEPGSRFSPDTEYVDALILDPLTSRTVRNKFMLFIIQVMIFLL